MTIIVTMAEEFPGRGVAEIVGLATGSIVRARFIGRDFIASLRNLVGGEVDEYTQLLSEARDEALQRMIAHAEELGADAVICFRFATSTVMEGSAEILAYGTAVRLT